MKTKTKKNLKKIFIWILALIMFLSLFSGLIAVLFT